MSSINKVILIGRAGKDPEVIVTGGGMSIANFSLATSESFKKGDDWKSETEWHNIKAFNKQAEYIGDKIKKGQLLYVEGKIKTSSWDAENGEKKHKTEIIVNTIRKLSDNDNKNISEPEQSKPQQNNPVPNTQTEDDLPF